MYLWDNIKLIIKNIFNYIQLSQPIQSLEFKLLRSAKFKICLDLLPLLLFKTLLLY
jgi:hypothetical protein